MAAFVKEHYRTVTGGEQELNRGFIVEDAISEHEAIDATRAFIEGKTPNEVFWPPLVTSDGSGDLGQATGIPPINHSKFLVDVAVEEIDLPDETRTAATATFKTAARYAYRAVCPIWDYNLSLAQKRVTVAESAVSYVDNTKLPDNETPLVIEPQATGVAAKGADTGAPLTEFYMTWNPMPIAPSTLDVEVLKYATEIQQYVGRTNETVFLKDDPQGFPGFPTGSLRFDGWQGKLIDQKNDLYEYRFKFSYGHIFTSDGGLEHNIGGIQIPATETYGGWDYLWIKWKTATLTQNGKDTLLPEAETLNFARTAKRFDFYLLFMQDAKPDPTGAKNMIPSSCPGFTDFTTSYWAP